jgi:hypothetical protein
VIVEVSSDDSSYSPVDGRVAKDTGITSSPGNTRFIVPFDNPVYGRYVRIHSVAVVTITALRAGVMSKLYTECLKNATCDDISRKYICKRHFCDAKTIASYPNQTKINMCLRPG